MSSQLLFFPPCPPIGVILAAASFLVTGFCGNPFLTLNVGLSSPGRLLWLMRLWFWGVHTANSGYTPQAWGAESSACTDLGLFLEGTISWWCPGFRESSGGCCPFFSRGVCGWGMGNQGPLTPWSPADAFRGFSGHWECLYVKDCSLLILVLSLNFISHKIPP